MRLVLVLGIFLVIPCQVQPAGGGIHGTVIDAMTGEPLPDVRVQQLPDRRMALEDGVQSSIGVSGPGPRNDLLQTDVNGRFLIEHQNAVRIRLAFRKAGYLSKTLDYTLQPGLVEEVVVSLARSSAISGRVLERDGRPAADTRVVAIFHDYYSHRWRLIYHLGATTNAQGEFRISGLLPRRYWIAVLPRGDIETSTYRAVLYPGVDELSKATPIHIEASTEFRLRDMVRTLEPPRAINVNILNPRGEGTKDISLAFANVTPVVFDVGGGYGMSDGVRVLPWPNVENRLQSGRRLRRSWSAPLPGTYSASVRWQDLRGPIFMESTTVEFAGKDLDVELITKPPEATVLCSIRFEESDGSRRLIPSISTMLWGRQNGLIQCRSGPYGLSMDGPVRAGLYDIISITGNPDRTHGFPDDLYVQSARQVGRDVLSRGLEVTQGDTTLEIGIRGGAGVLRGKVMNARGGGLHDAAVVLVPEPNADAMRPLIAYRQGRTDQYGGFELRGIIPGSYRIYAWSEMRPNEFMDPDFMKKFESRGQPMEVRQHDRLSIDLSVLDAS